ncbi:Uncharacterized protein TCM_011311 [Theobroma cacao]|uniref:Uncharacterized protein n=1 Tax=Theobroma cacao TaxID=3641 RepID=A0A061EAI8_THECC|nr:Uncharacterized protein TCM_011311 [Theobroma cacao]
MTTAMTQWHPPVRLEMISTAPDPFVEQGRGNSDDPAAPRWPPLVLPDKPVEVVFKGDKGQMEVVMGCLNEFVAASGLAISLPKSKLFVSPNVSCALLIV